MQGPVVQKPISANFILNIIMASKFRLIFSKPCGLHSGLNIFYLIYLRRYIYKLYSDFKNYYWEKRWISPISILSQMKRKGLLSYPQIWYYFLVGTFGKWDMSNSKSKSWGCYWIRYIFNYLQEFIKPYW